MNIGLILAGGKGTRMGMVDKPKQFIDIYGKPIVIHTAETFDLCPGIDAIAIVCMEEWQEDLRHWIKKYEINKVKWIISGGTTRQESVRNGLKELGRCCCDDDIVVIHDAARPLLSLRIIEDNIEGAKKHGAVDTVIPSADTIIKSLDDVRISDVPARRQLYTGQTPQSFRYGVIRKVHEFAEKNNITDSTDDCQLVLKYGTDVYLVRGEKLNFKITTIDDLLLLKAVLKLGNIGDDLSVLKKL